MAGRWPRKREFLFYYLLYRYFGQHEFNVGDAIDLLRIFTGSKKVARRIVKRLVKQGFLQRIKPGVYRAKDLDALLDEMLWQYLGSRLARRGLSEEEARELLLRLQQRLKERH